MSINFNDLPSDIKNLIFKENRMSAYKKRQETNKHYLLNHINMLNNIYNNMKELLEKDEDNEPSTLLDHEYCMEYLQDLAIDLEYERLQEIQFNEYYNL